MLYFLFFILGILFSAYIMPLLDSLFTVVLTKLEVSKGKYAFEATKVNLQIEQLTLDTEGGGQQLPAIGFQYVPEEEEEFDDDI